MKGYVLFFISLFCIYLAEGRTDVLKMPVKSQHSQYQIHWKQGTI